MQKFSKCTKFEFFQNSFIRFQIFLHEAGLEYWIQYGLNPSKKEVVYISTDTKDGTFGIQGKLKYHSAVTAQNNSKCILVCFWAYRV